MTNGGEIFKNLHVLSFCCTFISLYYTMFHTSLPRSLLSPLFFCKFLLLQGLTVLPIGRYTILSVLNVDNAAIYSIVSIHMNRTFLYLFPYHLFHLCNSTTTYSAGQVSNDLRSWDYPLFFILHFILFL